MKKLVLITLLALSSSAYAQTKISDPLKYAFEVAREFSLGDSGYEGEYDCRNGTDEELEVGGNIRIVTCTGTRQILVHGGHMTTANFECRLTFEPAPMSSTAYQVTSEQCQ